MEKDIKMIGEAIAHFRKALGYTQGTLADVCGLSINTIQKVEKGTTDPSLLVRTKISEALGVPFKFIQVFVNEDLCLKGDDLTIVKTADGYFKDLIEEKYLG